MKKLALVLAVMFASLGLAACQKSADQPADPVKKAMKGD
jgi:hypothetical protein